MSRHSQRGPDGKFTARQAPSVNGSTNVVNVPRVTSRDLQVGDMNRRLAVLSTLIDRSRFGENVGSTFEGERSIQKVLGYRRFITYEDYLYKYERQDVASKIIELPAEDSWRKPPKIMDGDQDDAETEFSKAVQRLNRQHRLYHYMKRADILCGIGHYSVILLGFRGDSDLSQPVTLRDGESVRELAYMRTFGESRAEIKSWVTDEGNPRFGLPETYELTFVDTKNAAFRGQASQSSITSKKIVHHSRIIHVVEGALEDEVFGVPRLRKVYDRLDDMLKVAGGSAEVFWLVASFILHIDIDPEYETDPGDMEDLDNKLQEIGHNLRRTLQTQGAKVEAIGAEGVDPTGAFAVQQLLVAAAAGIPVRILFGSERGELASSQDMDQWRGRIKGRQEDHVEPQILRRVLARLVEYKVLPEPTDGDYQVKWPPLFEPSPKTQADRALAAAQAAAAYSPGAAELLIPPHEMREEFLGLPARPPVAPAGGEEDFEALEKRLKEEHDVKQQPTQVGQPGGAGNPGKRGPERNA